jgi:mercuric ion binding protein
MRKVLWAAVGSISVLAGTAYAETKVEVKNSHICCPACEGAVAKTLNGVDGAKGSADKGTKTITVIAKDDQTAQKALDALAGAGFHGDTGNKDLKIKDDSGAGSGKVSSLTVKGAHNCCGNCVKILKATVKKVNGVESDNIEAKGSTFTVKGNFDSKELVSALNEAGFHVKIEK